MHPSDGCLGKQADDWSFALELFQSLEGHGLDLETWWSKNHRRLGRIFEDIFGKKKMTKIEDFFVFFKV